MFGISNFIPYTLVLLLSIYDFIPFEKCILYVLLTVTCGPVGRRCPPIRIIGISPKGTLLVRLDDIGL